MKADVAIGQLSIKLALDSLNIQYISKNCGSEVNGILCKPLKNY